MEPGIIEGGPFKVFFDNNPWVEVPAIIIVILAVYAGMRLIKRWIPDRPPK